LKAIYVPHDYSALNLKNPLSSSGTEVPQRLFILIQSGPASQIGVARITVSTNWEGTPGPLTQDFIRPSVSFQDILSQPESNIKIKVLGEAISKYIFTNRLVITEQDDDFGITKFAELIKAVI
jgi:hypothetical protein